MGLFKKTQHRAVRQPHITDVVSSVTFRRSRTMTGSLSDSVRAAAEHRGDLKSDRIKHHTLRLQRRHLFLYLLATLTCIAGLLFLINNFIRTVVVASDTLPVADARTYESAINTYLLAHPNERFAFTLRNDSLTETLQKDYPEIASVSVAEEPWLRASIATVTLRQAIASWTIGQTKYYIDAEGVAYKKNIGFEPRLVVEDKTGIDPSSTGAVASQRMLHYIGRLVALLHQRGYTVQKLELPLLTSREVDVYLSGIPYTIKTDIDRDPAGEAADIASAIHFLSAKGITPSYADVRVSSRLYYK